jgi:hypothetical protein
MLVPFIAPANGVGMSYVYVASVQADGTISTYPGPATGDPAHNPVLVQTLPTNFAGTPNMTADTFGPNEVFAGSAVYFEIRLALLSGPQAHLFIYNTCTPSCPNTSHDGVVAFTGIGTGTPDKIAPHVIVGWANPTGDDSNDQLISASRKLGYGYMANNSYNAHERLRVAPDAVPGSYILTTTLEQNGQVVPFTYKFTVLPAATAPPPVKLTPTPIPGLATWESQMTTLGKKWCDNRDAENLAGSFEYYWGVQTDTWFYDGGRVYQNLEKYLTDKGGTVDHAYWQHCTGIVLDPYAQYDVASGGSQQGYSMFTYGLYQWYLRTRAQVARDAIHALGYLGPQRQQAGSDLAGIRENAYRVNNWVNDERLTGQRHPLVQRNVDHLIGNLLQISEGHDAGAHPFFPGVAMEALIGWADLNEAEGHPDYRVLPVVMKTLNYQQACCLLDGRMLVYDRLIVPTNHGIQYSGLNNLVSVAAAWAWSKTGDPNMLAFGDLLFQHAFDEVGAPWSGKGFAQQFEFSFDFVRYRQGLDPTYSLANNPYTGPYADTEPPITTQPNCEPNWYPGCKAGSIGSTTAQMFWGTYEPATTWVIYGTTTAYGNTSPVDLTMATSHVVNLVGLTPGTTYHFRDCGKDAAGNQACMKDLTFTTTP